MLSKTFNEYLISMGLNMSKLEKKIKSSKRLLKSYEHLYNSYVDDEINNTSVKQSSIFQVFSAINAVFLPLNMVAAYMGMNITVPYQVDNYDSLWPFSVILLMCLGYFILILILFKLKSWL